MDHADIYGKNVLGSGNSKYKGPRATSVRLTEVALTEVACRVAGGSSGRELGPNPWGPQNFTGAGVSPLSETAGLLGWWKQTVEGWLEGTCNNMEGADGRWDKHVSWEGSKG